MYESSHRKHSKLAYIQGLLKRVLFLSFLFERDINCYATKLVRKFGYIYDILKYNFELEQHWNYIFG